MVKIAPSILAADFMHLEDEIKSVEEAGADFIHLDVMDGKFVPNQTPGAKMINTARKVTNLPIDTHLMVENPMEWVEEFASSSIVTFHIEAVNSEDVENIIKFIHEKGIKAGIAIKPKTPVKKIIPFLNMIEMVLVMTVEPGFGGQKLIGSTLRKVKKIRKMNKNIDIEVDGGINIKNIKKVQKAGANVIVAGTAIFSSGDRKDTIKRLKAPNGDATI